MIRLIYNIVDDFLDKTVVFGYDKVGYNIRKFYWDPEELRVSMKGKVCIVTGANSGLGKATCVELALRGATVVMICRNKERGELAQKEIIQASHNHNVFLYIYDLSLRSSVRKFSEVFCKTYNRLDVLVNNAGVLLHDRQITSEGLESTFATNTIAYHLMIYYLLPHLKNTTNSRVINVTSGGMYLFKLNIDDLQFEKEAYNGLKAYSMTKRAEVILTEMWAEKLKQFGVTVNAMHPGWAHTPSVERELPNFFSITRPLLRTPSEGADTIVWLAIKPKWVPWDTGKLYFDRKERAKNRLPFTTNSPEEKKNFWKICCEIGGIEVL